MYIPKRKAIYYIVFALFLIASIIGLIIFNQYEYNGFNQTMSYSTQKAISDLTEHVNQVNSAFEKGKYTTSPYQQIMLSSQIWRETSAAKTALENLPLDYTELEGTEKFLTQAGDFAYLITKKAARGEEISDAERETMINLAKGASAICDKLNSIFDNVSGGELTTDMIDKMLKKGTDSENPTLYDNLKVSDSEFKEFPTLIYDGPFSDHIGNTSPVLLEGKTMISMEKAKEIFAKSIGVETGRVTYDQEISGNVPCYKFIYGDFEGGITKKGGYLLYLTNSRAIGDTTLSYEDAVAKAKAYLENNGYKNMKESYYINDGETLVINFAYEENGAVCYPDLIKIGVALDNGQIISVEASNYISNHKEGRDTSVTFTKEQAQKNISTDISIENYKLSVIPTDGKYEVLCHEFSGKTADGQTVLCYVNAKTGIEERILLIVQTDRGVLTK